jgi:Enoyl-(Acyl carrier protein) reductase/Antibiotic biosynthesis monooxygenase
MVAPTRSEPGCVSYEVFATADETTALYVIESWNTRADAARHAQRVVDDGLISARKPSWTGRSHPSGWNRRRRPNRNPDQERKSDEADRKDCSRHGGRHRHGAGSSQAADRTGQPGDHGSQNKARLETEAASLPGAAPFACDISDESQVAGLVDYVQQHHPELDILLLNAGVTHLRPVRRGRRLPARRRRGGHQLSLGRAAYPRVRAPAARPDRARVRHHHLGHGTGSGHLQPHLQRHQGRLALLRAVDAARPT